MTARKSLVIIGAVLLVAVAIFFGVNRVYAEGPITVPPGDPNAECINCHSLSLSVTLADGALDGIVDYSKFQASKHGIIVQCVICHADIASYATLWPHPSVIATSIKDYRVAANQVCGECHTQEMQDLQTSIHGAQTGIQIATCTDCHSAHYTLATGAFPSASTQETNEINTYRLQTVTDCGKCHGDEELMRKYGLSTNVVRSYLQDFHGKTSYLVGEEAKNLSIQTAVCSDCHKSENSVQQLSSHAIQLITTANQAAFQQSFQAACQRCHPGASATFSAAWLSHNQPSTNYAQAVFGVSWFYRIMIGFVVIGLFIHISFDIYKRRKNKKEA